MEVWFLFIMIFISLVLGYCPWKPITFIVASLTIAFFGVAAIFHFHTILREDWDCASIVALTISLLFALIGLQSLVQCCKEKKPVNEEWESLKVKLRELEEKLKK